MIDFKRIIKPKNVKILFFAGILKLSVLLFLTRKTVSLDFDLISSIALFLAFLIFFARFIPEKLNFKRLFLVGFLAMFIYNWVLGAFGLADALTMNQLISSALDFSVATMIMGYFMGVRKW